MGKGDIKSRRGKISAKSFGKRRRRKHNPANKKTAARPVSQGALTTKPARSHG